MIFADKLIALRKKAGYSQEELAQQLNVTRQSVSKWEGAQSVPDIEKILQISKLFGVTTDYLLKDEMGEPEYAESEPTALRRVTLEQANAALAQAKVNAPYMAWGTALCVASPVMLLLLGEICQHSQFGLNENVATGIGLCVLLVMVCVAVVLFMLCGTKNRDFDFLEKEPFETEYGVTGMVRERQAAYRPTYDKLNLTGTVLCILSAIPLFVAMMVNSGIVMNAAVCVLLVLVACGVFAFVLGGTYYGATEKLLEEGDYTRHSKATRELRTAISVVYWLVVTAAFLLYTFGPKGNGQPQYSWFIWAIAGVLYAAVLAVLCAVVLVFWMGNLSTPVTAEEAGIWLYSKKEDGANLCVLEVQGENVRLETEGGFSWGKEYITVRAMRYTFPGLHAALTKLTGSETVSTEIAVSRTQVLAVECADGTRYYSDSQQVERFIAGENPDGTVRYGYGTEEQYGHDFKKG